MFLCPVILIFFKSVYIDIFNFFNISYEVRKLFKKISVYTYEVRIFFILLRKQLRILFIKINTRILLSYVKNLKFPHTTHVQFDD